MHSYQRVLARVTGYLVISLMALGLMAGPALASGPIVYNQKGGKVPLNYTPVMRVSSGVIQPKGWLPQGSRFRMECWLWGQYETTQMVNYPSSKWFYGQSLATGQWGYVHSSFVYYQISVPKC